MNIRKRVVLALAFLVLALSAILYAILCRSPGFLDVSGPYLGQDPPGTRARLFAPGIVPRYFSRACGIINICKFS